MDRTTSIGIILLFLVASLALTFHLVATTY
jgi:hypothetical protein